MTSSIMTSIHCTWSLFIEVMNQAEDIVVYILFHVSHLVFTIGML